MQESNITRAHACFRLDIRFPISIDDRRLIESDSDLLDLWHAHSYRVVRSPNDLLAHTRRVRLCHEPTLNDRLLGALLDLEYVLGSNGHSLLERLNTESASILGNIDPPNDPEVVKGRVLPSIKQLLEASSINEPPDIT